jgi:hypothetical protein
MTTAADALEVMTIVAACHHRTAPRMDDRQAAIATARVWAELFSAHRLDLPDLIAGVKKRALSQADAPEPAEIIHHAREIRRDRDARTGPTRAYEALCESKSEDAAELAAINQ